MGSECGQIPYPKKQLGLRSSYYEKMTLLILMILKSIFTLSVLWLKLMQLGVRARWTRRKKTRKHDFNNAARSYTQKLEDFIDLQILVRTSCGIGDSILTASVFTDISIHRHLKDPFVLFTDISAFFRHVV